VPPTVVQGHNDAKCIDVEFDKNMKVTNKLGNSHESRSRLVTPVLTYPNLFQALVALSVSENVWQLSGVRFSVCFIFFF